jgi:hypothetical protein
MRTTLNIDDDVLWAAKELAKQEGKTAGQVVSELARRALQAGLPSESNDENAENTEFFGFSPLPKRGVMVTNELIDNLRDEEGI